MKGKDTMPRPFSVGRSVPESYYRKADDEKITVRTNPCMGCNKVTTLHVSYAGYKAWRRGELIQKAFPELDENERELLISGMCPTCFDELPED